MLIEIPVTIGFNCEDGHATFRAARGFARTFTMRYDTTDTNRPAEFCTEYPPHPATSTWTVDKDGVLFAFMSSAVDRALAAAAERDPESYAVAQAERELVG